MQAARQQYLELCERREACPCVRFVYECIDARVGAGVRGKNKIVRTKQAYTHRIISRSFVS